MPLGAVILDVQGGLLGGTWTFLSLSGGWLLSFHANLILLILCLWGKNIIREFLNIFEVIYTKLVKVNKQDFLQVNDKSCGNWCAVDEWPENEAGGYSHQFVPGARGNPSVLYVLFPAQDGKVSLKKMWYSISCAGSKPVLETNI